MVSAMVLLVCTTWHVSADGTAFMAADTKTPFDPVFSPAVGPNAVNPAMALKQFINPDYVATTHRLKDIHAGRLAEPVPGNRKPETVTGLPPGYKLLVVSPSRPSAGPKSGGERGLVSTFFALFGFGSHENSDERKISVLAPSKADTPTTEPDLAGEVIYRYTEDGVPVASLSLASNEEDGDALPEPGLKSVSMASESIVEGQQKTGRNPVADLPQAIEQENRMASLSESGTSRDLQEPTIADAAAAFFEGSTDGVHTRTGKPGEGDHTRKKQQPGPTISFETGNEDTTGKIRITKRVVREADTLLGQIDASGMETLLVDENMARSGQGTIKEGDLGFVVDVPVPISNTQSLKEEQLVLGLEGALGKSLPFADDPDEHCVRRHHGQVWICLESLGWPSVIEDAFATNRLSPGRTNAIIRYDQGIATQYRVSFPAESFDRIAAHFQYLLGAPSGHPDVMVPVFARPGKANRVVQWIAAESGNGPPAILEMREIDDVRWSDTPDTEHGVVRLYRRGMNPVFSMVMAGEIRLIGMKHHNSDKPAFTTAP